MCAMSYTCTCSCYDKRKGDLMIEQNCTQDAEQRAMSMMLREHLAELRDWYREEDNDDSNSKAEENK